MPRCRSNLMSSSSGRKKIPFTAMEKSAFILAEYWMNPPGFASWLPERSVKPCLLRSVKEEDGGPLLRSVSTAHLIWLNTRIWRLLRTHSSRHHRCILHASATFYILRSNPLFFLSMNHPSACPHFRVSPNLALFWSRPCVVVKSSLETRSSMSPLLFHPGWIKIFISDADSIQRRSL